MGEPNTHETDLVPALSEFVKIYFVIISVMQKTAKLTFVFVNNG